MNGGDSRVVLCSWQGGSCYDVTRQPQSSLVHQGPRSQLDREPDFEVDLYLENNQHNQEWPGIAMAQA